MQRNTRSIIRRILIYVFFVFILIYVLFPLYWMVVTALKSHADITASPPIYLPLNPSMKSFKTAIGLLFPGLGNSIIVALGSTAFSLFLGALAAYGFARYKFKGKKHLFFWILTVRMFPPIVSIIPLFLIFKTMKLIDTHFSLILAYGLFNLPFTIWILRSFIESIPTELEDAAKMDGCSDFRVFGSITLPLILPGVVAAVLLSFIFCWNEFLFALVLTRTNAITLPIALAGLRGTWGVDWGRVGALGLYLILPIILLCRFLQKYIVRGMTFGGLKG